MQEKSLIELSLTALKKRLENNNQMIEVYGGRGHIGTYTCRFHEPATLEQIRAFEEKTGWILPEDYKNFLLITNGCRLFDHPEYGGENILYSLDEILFYAVGEPFEGRYTIADLYGDHLVIDSHLYQSGDPDYLLVKDKIAPLKDARKLYMNFELWFDRFLISQGSSFWNWPVYTAKNYDR
ncbi:SMI1/KNR4 family protein [Lihuaxuella thermophila]|uniref:SMI1 / KNR4 family (SUKH-1) n=1 Tax=Lihuaxuella thermophila TaxID=1173111 RepID=A0A1H8BU82_9BACL|nr:SMI1/KNR4 family protein [Lihuaxuella thermophila]SEM85694.1 SMI1 / KNR4 family (SUKH-1) [Lihuaxuella thermophila]